LFGMEDAVRQSRDDDLEKRAYESITEAEKTVCLAGQVVLAVFLISRFYLWSTLSKYRKKRV